MNRLSYLIGRLVKGVFVILAIGVLAFLVIRLVPGDPVAVIAGKSGAVDAEYMDNLRQKLGLDQPLVVQLGIFLKGLVQGDLGQSYRQGAPVSAIILERLPATLLLTLSASAISILLGVLAGAMAARRRGTWADSAIGTLALLFYATPLFWMGLMAILLFSLVLGWFPAFGMVSADMRYEGIRHVLDVLHHLIMPMTILGLFYMAVYARLTRASMLEVSEMDFVRTARAKGLPESYITRRHILRNALLPIITFAGIQAGHLIGGTVLIETVFGWPGIGRLAFDSLLQRDYPVLLGIFIVTSAMVVIFNILTDLLYTLVDPRIEVNK
ncbi:ABC transporter permease [Neptunicoccus sediminis]|uniref:ABC transporter permease n=1 Tax=Neptunicoccus sediminis TaxID=1892596 RepID=UPI0008460D3C|nr:ABC transporter permease [Neptunicoccus sediminis]